MAKIIMADGSEIRGKIGGKVYSRNASGAYVRKFVKPVNPSTSLQATARNNFKTISQAYRDLSDADKASYEAMRQYYTRQDSVGNTVTPTASQLFARINGKLLQNGVINSSTFITTCPVPNPVVNTQSAAPVYDTTAEELTYAVVFAS